MVSKNLICQLILLNAQTFATLFPSGELTALSSITSDSLILSLLSGSGPPA